MQKVSRRREIRQQARRGWVPVKTAAILLGFDMDHSKVSDLGKSGTLKTRQAGGHVEYLLDDILTHSGQSLTTLLNRHVPINRQKAPPRNTAARVLKSCKERQAFERRWHRLHGHVSRLIATKAADLGRREHRLVHQLLELSHRAKAFELIVSTAKLKAMTDLDDDSLPKARYSLESRGILAKDSPREGTTARRYTFIDPWTMQPFGDTLDDSDIRVYPSTSWPGEE